MACSHQSDFSAFQIKDTNNYWVVGERYRILNMGSDELLQNAVLVKKQTIRIEDLQEEQALIWNDCDLLDAKHILSYSGHNMDRVIDLLWFSPHKYHESFFTSNTEIDEKIRMMETKYNQPVC